MAKTEKNIKNETKDNNNNFKFSVIFNNDGESFQNVMENIILSKLQKDNLKI